MKKHWVVMHKDSLGEILQEGLIIAISYGKAMAKLEEYLIELYQGCVVRVGNYYYICDEIDSTKEDKYYLQDATILKE